MRLPRPSLWCTASRLNIKRSVFVNTGFTHHQDHTLGSTGPDAGRHRTNSPHRFPDHKPDYSVSRRRGARSGVASARSSQKSWLFNSLITILNFTLRRSQGAIARYQAAPGVPLAAAQVEVPRRPWTAPTTIPGAGEGVKNSVRCHIALCVIGYIAYRGGMSSSNAQQEPLALHSGTSRSRQTPAPLRHLQTHTP